MTVGGHNPRRTRVLVVPFRYGVSVLESVSFTMGREKKLCTGSLFSGVRVSRLISPLLSHPKCRYLDGSLLLLKSRERV